VGSALVLSPLQQESPGADARAATLFYANMRFAGQATDYFAQGADPSPFQHFWSLSVEEQFYALWPLVFLAVGAVVAVRYRRVALVAVVSTATAVSFALSNMWLHDDAWLTEQPIKAFFLLPSRLWELGIGVLLALSVSRVERLGPTARRWLLAVGLVAIAASVFGLSAKTVFPGWIALLPTLGTAAVLAAGTGANVASRLSRFLSHRVMQLGGRYSYSLYLWHWPIVVLLSRRLHSRGGWPVVALVAGVTTTVAAVATFHLVEDPLRRARPLRTRPSFSLAFGAACVALCVLAASALDARARDQMRDGASTSQVAAALGATATDIVPSAVVPAALAPTLPDITDALRDDKCQSHCETNRNGRPTVALVGDSHAWHFEPAFNQLAKALDVTFVMDWKPGCTWFAVVPAVDSVAPCEQYRDEVFARYRANPPDVIVLSSRNDVPFARDPAGWLAGMAHGFDLLPSESKLIVLGESPSYRGASPLRCLSENLQRTKKCDAFYNVPVNVALKAAVAGRATFVDLFPVFCVAGRCPAIINGVLVYADDHHVTTAFAESLSAWFAEAVSPALPN
jgi:peptidoglycan/LPS O-acetylase OafA/YrhL